MSRAHGLAERLLQSPQSGGRDISVVLELPPDLENELTSEARQLGLSLAEYALRLLSSGRTPGAALRTGADLLAYWQTEGLTGTHADIADSQAHAGALREAAQTRKRA